MTMRKGKDAVNVWCVWMGKAKDRPICRNRKGGTEDKGS